MQAIPNLRLMEPTSQHRTRSLHDSPTCMRIAYPSIYLSIIGSCVAALPASMRPVPALHCTAARSPAAARTLDGRSRSSACVCAGAARPVASRRRRRFVSNVSPYPPVSVRGCRPASCGRVVVPGRPI
jgi:hypothetical protein